MEPPMEDVYVDVKYRPHTQQIPFHLSTAKFRGIITGVGFGKTACGAAELLKVALEYPARYLILAPTSKIMTYATLTQFWKFCPKELIIDHIKSQNLIRLANGSELIYLTADNERHVDRLRGMEVGAFWADESRLFPGYVWDVVLTRLRDARGPLRGWVTTTPNGYDWLYYYFVKRTHPVTKKLLPNPEDYEWFGGSTLDNPYTPEEFKKNLLAQLGGKFRNQEIYGEFVGFEGQVYDCFRHETHIVDKVPICERHFIGLDFGFNHPMAAVLIGVDSDGVVYVIDEFYERRSQVETVGQWLRAKTDEYDVENIYADPSQPMMIEKLHEMGLSVSKAKNEVMAGINFVYGLMEIDKETGKPRLYIHRRCENLIDEINKYRYADKKGDSVQKDEPLKINDDAADGLRYGIFSSLGKEFEYTVLDTKESGGFF